MGCGASTHAGPGSGELAAARVPAPAPAPPKSAGTAAAESAASAPVTAAGGGGGAGSGIKGTGGGGGFKARKAADRERMGSVRASITDMLVQATAGGDSPTTSAEASKGVSALIKSLSAIAAELSPERTMQVIVSQAAELLVADRATVFRVDHEAGELVTSAAEGTQAFRIAIGEGVAGRAASLGEPVVVNTPEELNSAQSSFSRKHDDATGYKTRTLLAVPALDREGQTVAVLEIVNKHAEADKGRFTPMDVVLASNLASMAGICMRNSELYARALANEKRANALVDMVTALASEDVTANSLMFTITRRAQELLNAEKCTFFVCDHVRELLWSATTDSGKQIRLPITAGLVGSAATSKQNINIIDAYKDDRFNQEYDKKTGFVTRNILCVPIVSSGTKGIVDGIKAVSADGKAQGSKDKAERRCLAVLQAINKMGQDGCFTAADEELMSKLGELVSRKVEEHDLVSSFHRQAPAEAGGGKNEANAVFGGMSSSRTRRTSINAFASFDEGEEGEEGE